MTLTIPCPCPPINRFGIEKARKFRSGQKGLRQRVSLKFAGDDSAILISVCVSVSLRFRESLSPPSPVTLCIHLLSYSAVSPYP